jgi:hypothetical protein
MHAAPESVVMPAAIGAISSASLTSCDLGQCGIAFALGSLQSCLQFAAEGGRDNGLGATIGLSPLQCLPARIVKMADKSLILIIELSR